MNSIKKNLAYNTFYQILLIILPLITTPYVSRVMGPSSVGTYSYTYSIASYFVLIAMLGVNNYGNRSVAMVRDNRGKLSKTFWEIYYLQLSLSLLMSICYIAFLLFFIGENNNEIVYILQFIYVISVAFDINWFFFGMEKFKLIVIRNICIRLTTIMLIFLFVKSSDDLWLYTLIMAVGALVSQLAIWPFVIKNVYFIKPNLRNIKNHIKPNLVLFVPVIAVSFYKIMDKVMLGSLSDSVQVGLYAYSENIISVPMSLITALGTVMLPRMSNLAAKGEIKKSKSLIEKSMLFTMITSSALAFGIAGIAPVLAPWFLGKEFAESGQLITLLALTIVFISWANVVRTQYLIPYFKDKIYIISVIAGAIVNIIMNFMLIPSMGAIGACIGTIFAEAVVCVIQTFMVRNELEFKAYLRSSVIFLVFGYLMFLVVRSLSTISSIAIITLITQVFIGALIYIALSLFYLIKIKRDYWLINSILSFLKVEKKI